MTDKRTKTKTVPYYGLTNQLKVRLRLRKTKRAIRRLNVIFANDILLDEDEDSKQVCNGQRPTTKTRARPWPRDSQERAIVWLDTRSKDTACLRHARCDQVTTVDYYCLRPGHESATSTHRNGQAIEDLRGWYNFYKAYDVRRRGRYQQEEDDCPTTLCMSDIYYPSRHRDPRPSYDGHYEHVLYYMEVTG